MTAFDTNILIYTCDRSDAGRQKKALELLDATEDGVLLWQVAAEFIAASRKLSAQGFTPAQAWARLNDFMGVLHLLTPRPQALEQARSLHLERGLSFWDALIIGACLDSGIDTLYSEDLPGTISAGLHIINPFR